jgi:hypothetical protein
MVPKLAAQSCLLRVLGRGRQASVRVFVLGLTTMALFLVPYVMLAMGYRPGSSQYMWAFLATMPVALLLFSKMALDRFVKADLASGKSALDAAWEDHDERTRLSQSRARREQLSEIADRQRPQAPPPPDPSPRL